MGNIPSSAAEFEYEPTDEFLLDLNYSLPKNIIPRPTAKINRIHMLITKCTHAILDSPMSIIQDLPHPCAEEFIRAFAAKVQSLKNMKIITLIYVSGRRS
jgi:hypothetical protein